jgi:toxin ParE1/3/4
MRVEWSDDALADLDRFAAFLQQLHPLLANIVAEEIIDKAQLLSEHPLLGRAIKGREEYPADRIAGPQCRTCVSVLL